MAVAVIDGSSGCVGGGVPEGKTPGGGVVGLTADAAAAEVGVTAAAGKGGRCSRIHAGSTPGPDEASDNLPLRFSFALPRENQWSLRATSGASLSLFFRSVWSPCAFPPPRHRSPVGNHFARQIRDERVRGNKRDGRVSGSGIFPILIKR